MAGSGEARKKSSSSSTRSSKRRTSSDAAAKEEEEVVSSSPARTPAAKVKSADSAHGSDSDSDRELPSVQSVDRVRRKKKSLRDKAMEQSRSNSERHVRKKRQKADTEGGEERRTRKTSESKKESRKASLTPTGSERVEQPSKSKSTPPTKEAIDVVAAVLAAGAEDSDANEVAEEATAERGLVSEKMAEAQLEVDHKTIELVQKMQTHMESLEEALRLSQEENAEMQKKISQMNIDVRDVQLQVKKLNKQHADEVIDRFKQYERLFSTSILSVQSAAEKCVATVQVNVKEAVEAVLAEHKESLTAALQQNLEAISSAGAEHVTSLKAQLATEMERLSAEAAAQHEALARSLGERATQKVEPNEITRQLLLALVEQTFAAMGGPDDYEDSEDEGEASDSAERGAADDGKENNGDPTPEEAETAPSTKSEE